MAGRGPAPKSNKARRNAEPIPLRVIQSTPSERPDLPELPEDMFWPKATTDWWNMLANHPLAHEFTELDWSYLMDTAMLHAAFWHGDTKVASEIRLREAKYAFTPEDRARLRIQFAAADEADEKRTQPKSTARQRRGPLTAS